MNILHIFRNPPDDLVRSIIPAAEPLDQITEVNINDAAKDYDRLLDLVMENDKVFTWF